MSSDKCPGLSNVYGDNFKELDCHYESEGRGRKTISARDLWCQILDTQMETGTPYLLYKEAIASFLINRHCKRSQTIYDEIDFVIHCIVYSTLFGNLCLQCLPNQVR